MRRASLISLALATALACGDGLPTEPERSCPAPARPSVRLTLPPGPGECPTADEIAGLDVPVLFEGDAGGDVLVCRAANGSLDLNVVQKNVYRALLFMQRAQFDAPLPWTDQPLWTWFRRSVTGIRIRTDIASHFCCDPSRTINLLGTIVADSTLPTEFVEMMVHEARHAEGARHTCGGGSTPQTGFTLDRRVDDLGAFGVQYYLLRWVGLHMPGATQAEREYALNRAAWLRVGAFCLECD